MSFILGNRVAKEIEKVTEDQLILSLCREKDLGIEGSNEELIQKFRETYKDQADLITKAAQGDTKALRRLRWIFGLKVITKTDHSAERR
jgi:hypothetical protein